MHKNTQRTYVVVRCTFFHGVPCVCPQRRTISPPLVSGSALCMYVCVVECCHELYNTRIASSDRDRLLGRRYTVEPQDYTCMCIRCWLFHWWYFIIQWWSFSVSWMYVCTNIRAPVHGVNIFRRSILLRNRILARFPPHIIALVWTKVISPATHCLRANKCVSLLRASEHSARLIRSNSGF